jgi:histidine triad (HIT) family protein
MENHCIFCAIVKNQLPAEIIYQDETFLAFADIHPMAPVHLLIVPKQHVESLDHVAADQAPMLGDLLICAQTIARKLNLAQNGYRLMINTGKDGGQTMPHLHLHLLAGKSNLPIQVG